MSNGFLKLKRSDKTEWLLLNYPNAFLLLTHIAYRARRITSLPDSFELGTAEIGDWTSYGLTEKQYRTAKKKLVEFGLIEILATNRRAELGRNLARNSATGRATTGTRVKLIDLSIYDPNFEEEGDYKGDLRATSGRPKGDEQECKKEKNVRIRKEKNIKKEKIKFLNFVELATDEHRKLLESHGQEKINEFISRLDLHIGSKGDTYKSHYFTILNWINREKTPIVNGTYNKNSFDRRTKTKEGQPVSSPADGLF